MRVSCRVHDEAVGRIGEAGQMAMTAVPNDIELRLEQAAAGDRRTHKYRNQTGHLQAGTQMHVISVTSDDAAFDLEMGEEYASFVLARGFSRFDEYEAAAEKAIAADFARWERRIAGM